MALLSQQSHCESSSISFDKCRTTASGIGERVKFSGGGLSHRCPKNISTTPKNLLV